jgi:CheY-like chemotaxis protein
MRLLFIDDQPENLTPALRALRDAGEICEVSDFGNTESKIDQFRPDIVILDLFEGPTAEAKTTGLEDYDVVWNERFCPLIVYSALPEAATGRHPSHPFVKSAQKGRDLTQLTTAIDALRPNVDSLRDAEKHIRKQFALALRDVAPYAFKAFDTSADRIQAIVRSGRRRLAALMDADLESGGKLASWEHYLFPPIGSDVQLGDILMKVGSAKEEPNNFRVVLSPSCDLVASGGRTPKVSHVLVARCCSMKAGVKLIGIEKPSKTSLAKRFPVPVLTQGFLEALLPIPSLPDRLPCMAANLRELELLAFNEIGNVENQFERVASMDSPFRELVSWSYLQVAGRPGLPDRDVDKWAEEILASCLREEANVVVH